MPLDHESGWAEGKKTMELVPIGVIHAPFRESAGTPIQPFSAAGYEGRVEVFEPFVEGLRDLEGFQRVWLLFWCHRARAPEMTVIPYRDTAWRGLFATRVPARPNPIGMSAVRLDRIEGNILHIGELDILDGTPLLDIKPYVPQYDSYPALRCGWLDGEGVRKGTMVADSRFEARGPNQPHE
jgi:tRNA (adenine37-N6)-methyltransferase